MAATSKVSVLFHMSSVLFHMRKEDLEKQMNVTDNKRSYEHLLAIKLAYDGKTQKEIATALSRSLTTIYHWLNDWNENGLYGIFPNFGGGRPPHLNTKEMDELYQVITKQKPCDLMETDHVFWDVELVRKYANTKYDVNYTYSGMWKLVRTKFKLNYVTPFSKDYRKPDDAVEILKKDLRTSLKLSTKKKRL